MSEASDPAAIIAGLQAALREERKLLQTLIDHAPDLIFVKNRDCRFLVANLATARMMGVAGGEDLLGRCDHDLFPKEMADGFRADDLSVIRGDRPILNREERVIDPSGGEHWMLACKVPLHDAQGGVIGLIGVCRDITIRRKAEDALAQVNHALKEQIDRYQEEILRLRAELQRGRA